MTAILTICIELILISLKLAVLAIRTAAQLLCVPFSFFIEFGEALLMHIGLPHAMAPWLVTMNNSKYLPADESHIE